MHKKGFEQFKNQDCPNFNKKLPKYRFYFVKAVTILIPFGAEIALSLPTYISRTNCEIISEWVFQKVELKIYIS